MTHTIVGIILITTGTVLWDVYLKVSKERYTISQVFGTLPHERPHLYAITCAAWLALPVHWWWGVCNF